MIPAMYNDIRLSQSMLDEADQDTSLEYDEKEAYENFKQFYEDTLPEFRKAGTVVQFKVCCNHEPHLRGNVYVQFTSEEECAKAFALFNARWYASKQLSCEFSPVTKWKSAICGLFERNRCPRGKNCNFLHVYRNPGNEFSHRDDRSPNRTPFDGGRTSERSERGWRRDQWSRRRDPDRDRSRDRDWEQDRYRRRRERHWSRERDDDRRRKRRRSEEREHSRTSEKHENREQRHRRRSYSSDEGSERESEHKHLSERLSPDVNKDNGAVIDSEDGERLLTSSEKEQSRKRKHHSSDEHKHRRKAKKKHKHRSERKKKKKKRRNSSESDSSSSETDDQEH